MEQNFQEFIKNRTYSVESRKTNNNTRSFEELVKKIIFYMF